MTSTTALESLSTPTVVTGRATRVAIAGCGFIADVHLQVLRSLADVEVVAVCDPHRARAERLAKKFAVRSVFGSVHEMLAAGGIDAAHVLVPPALHAEIASACLGAGLHVLVEKPLVLRAEQVEALATLARQQRRVLAVNHNAAFHPAVRRLQQQIGWGRLGRLEHIALQHHVPLRQLETGDVGHFMFESPANILFEQGVHLFSIVDLLLGPSQRVRAVTSPPRSLQHGVGFVEDWQLAIDCERGSASVRMAFGRPLPEITLQAIGSDGAALLDLQRGSCWVRHNTWWPAFLDHSCNLARGSLHLARRAFESTFGYALGLFGLGFPDDPFLRSMRGSLRAFHRAVRGREALPPVMSATRAAAVLTTCEQSARAAGVPLEASPGRPPLPPPGPARPGEVVVLGGTGFVGRRCVRLLRAMGRPVTLLVRRPGLLADDLRNGSVRIWAGDAADPAALAAAFAGATAVLHLATAAGDDDGAVEIFMAAAVRAAAEAALAAKVKRFVYASSTAALWLGDALAIDGAAPPDPRPRARSPYARAKIAAERELAKLARAGLEVTVVRPAIVVGQGVFTHSGIGLWVSDNHCVGWGRGRHPLPLVLVDDCAAGLVAALDAKAAGGRSYNIAGDVRLSARDYVAEMASRTGRPYRFHATALWWMWLQEVGKYLVKAVAGRLRQWPSLRDLRSRSFRTVLDCSDAKRDLGFHPVADREEFLERVFGPAVAHPPAVAHQNGGR